jgi:hypothetical protein
MANPSPPIQRTKYRERQLLRARDLNTDQAYHLSARYRHNSVQHGWGIVYGLEIAADIDPLFAGEASLLVNPGIAVDGYGRELIVQNPVPICFTAFDQLNCDLVDVWLVYRSEFASHTGTARLGAAGGVPNRVREYSALLLTLADDEKTADVRRPWNVAAADLEGTLPTGQPRSDWPVFLGRVQRCGAEPELSILRPYATQRGEQLTAPSGMTQVQLGSEHLGDATPFTVRVQDEKGALTDRLGISREGNAYMWGVTRVRRIPTTQELKAQERERDETGQQAFIPPPNLVLADPILLHPSEISDPRSLLEALVAEAKASRENIGSSLSNGQTGAIGNIEHLQDQYLDDLRMELATLLNNLIYSSPPIRLHERAPDSFRRVCLRPRTRKMLAFVSALDDDDEREERAVLLLNRLLLEDAYPGWIKCSAIALVPGSGVEFRPLAATPTAAAPWQIYRTDIVEEGGTRELRIEIGYPPDKRNARSFLFSVGYRDAENDYEPCLKVDAAHRTTIYNDPVVEGTLFTGPIQADMSDSFFVEALVAGFLETASQGAQGGEAQKGPITATFVEPPTPDTIKPGSTFTFRVQIDNKSTGIVAAYYLIANIYEDGTRANQFYLHFDDDQSSSANGLPSSMIPPGGYKTATAEYKVRPNVNKIKVVSYLLGLGESLNPILVSAQKEIQVKP